MSDALNFTEIEGQHAELLPDRVVLGTFGGSCSSGPDGRGIDGIGTNGGEGVGGAGGCGYQHTVIDTPGAVSHSTQDVSGGDGIGGSTHFGR